MAAGLRWSIAALATAVLALTLLVACGEDEQTTQKAGTGEVRHDLAPLTKRFAALGTPTSATWMSGTLGSGDAPGPSSYWIDAVVEVDAATASSLGSTPGLAPATSAPDVSAPLASALPDGPLRTSDELDTAFSTSGFATTAYLDTTSATVVLVAKGQ